MTHHGEHEDDGHEDQPGPQENTDEATKADAGMTGTPAESYSPEGMDDDAGPDQEAGTYQPDQED